MEKRDLTDEIPKTILGQANNKNNWDDVVNVLMPQMDDPIRPRGTTSLAGSFVRKWTRAFLAVRLQSYEDTAEDDRQDLDESDEVLHGDVERNATRRRSCGRERHARQ